MVIIFALVKMNVTQWTKLHFKYYLKSTLTGDYKIFEFIKKKFIRHISQFLKFN